MEWCEQIEAEEEQCNRCKHYDSTIARCEEATHVGLIHEMWPIDSADMENGELCECFEEN